MVREDRDGMMASPRMQLHGVRNAARQLDSIEL